ncbi:MULTISPECIES: SDR family NAD(P)-dependent oxidoreductase [unclassified Novosphingobium]|uniref:SDR family NAD(P)-dependent oxidoreductase n=1 Tax=unclassified Novosphingobium TaxID=2644732 RepID=UPI00086DCE76|nr:MULTISPECIES: SDR family oxidoreductase [unclassified Novosphingobium]MBN9143293.1 glucose 1-dehydrogenase [Novosphingobium sp.]MDR6706382.1 NAD(P)-dependent dehydrogenase (short-subunit alcohol dehydrogenase family) [Novosphingobium sp. 1748]ODU82628.1 MAG: short-chain dehydrogenase [Novosphingobium sp. SCN 63-17]OJX89602.1 MAG: short-chain dehydrogenase [Novosphingobium sp. 63-713]
MMFDLTGKVAIVTGSTRGIGHAIAQAMMDAGARVVISSEDEADTARAAAEMGALGIACDVADDAALGALVDGTVAALGGIDIVVCNAGITGRPGPFSSVDMADYARVMAINLRSQVVLCNLAYPHLRARSGNAVLIASLSGLRGNGAINAYALAKAGVAQLARNLAVEWGPHGVRANAISPGFIATELSAPLLANEAFMTRRMGMTPLRRPGKPEEVAGATVFLSSAAGGFVTGHNLVVDGGTLITDGS